MREKFLNLLIFGVLGFVVNYIVTITMAVLSGHVMGGPSGFPLQYGASSFYGNQSFNHIIYVLDVIFWGVIVFFVWKLLQRSKKKKKK